MKDRINTIIQTEGMSPSSFADAIGVSRSSMNHILNGRNNPSLELISKILTRYDNINSDWLIFGRDPMYKKVKGIFQPDLFDQVVVEPDKAPEKTEYPAEKELTSPKNEVKNPIINHLTTKEPVSKKIAKIMILYTDKTYELLSPE